MLNEKQRAQAARRQQRFRERQEQARQCEQEAKGLPAMPTLTTMPGFARWRAVLKSAHALVAAVCGEMQSYYDARSEAWQESEKGEDFAARQELVDAVLSPLDDLTVEMR